jgi:hypothetical protein
MPPRLWPLLLLLLLLLLAAAYQGVAACSVVRYWKPLPQCVSNTTAHATRND